MNHTNRRIRPWTLLSVLVVCSAALAADGLFEGLPLVGNPSPEGGNDKFSFAILGDKTSGGEGKWPIFDRAVDSINLLEPDFVITVGDQIPGHMQERALWDAEWAEYLEHARRVNAPLLLVPGNHDIANIECYRFWKDDFGPTYYAFDYLSCHFLVLNTEEERFDGRGPVWQTMMTFVEKDLAAHAGARHTFLFFHKPMWDDPRYEEDWARIEAALGKRQCTIVAGHEHYMMAERRGNSLYVIQSATGGGIHLSPVKAFGGFHSFAYVTVRDDDVTYAVVEPEGSVWPVDVSPASFRKAIAYDVVRLDAEPGADWTASTVTVRAHAKLHNVLDKPINVEVAVEALDACGWEIASAEGATQDGGRLLFTESLEPGQRRDCPLTFRVSQDRLAYPPGVSWRIQYEGEWLENESFPMVQEAAVPIGPADDLRIVPEWQLVGPFLLGDIDTSHLPDDPKSANANMFKRFGPEDGYDPEREYEGGLKWFLARNQGRGLLNFNAIMGTLDHALGYALCHIEAPRPQRLYALMYSDNYSQAVLNGTLIDAGQDFGAPSGFVYVPLDLKAGKNTFIAKLINNRGDWFLRVLVADPEGVLKFSGE